MRRAVSKEALHKPMCDSVGGFGWRGGGCFGRWGSSRAYHDLGHGREAAGAEHLAGDAGSEDGGHDACADRDRGNDRDREPGTIGF